MNIDAFTTNGPVWTLVGCLLVGMAFLGKWLLSFIDRLAKGHREERDEWRKSNDVVLDRLEEIVVEIKEHLWNQKND